MRANILVSNMEPEAASDRAVPAVADVLLPRFIAICACFSYTSQGLPSTSSNPVVVPYRQHPTTSLAKNIISGFRFIRRAPTFKHIRFRGPFAEHHVTPSLRLIRPKHVYHREETA